MADFYLDNYGVGYGFLMSGIFTEAVNENGENSIIGSNSFHFLNTFIGTRRDDSKLSYNFKAAYTLIPRNSEDGAAKISQWRTSFLLGYHLNSLRRKSVNITAGLGVLGTISRGEGGTVQQNNGSGVSTFFRPSHTSHSKLLMLELGFTQFITKNFTYSIESMINGLFGDRRNFNIYFNFSYAWNPGVERRIRKFSEKSDEENFTIDRPKKKKRSKRKKKSERRVKVKKQ